MTSPFLASPFIQLPIAGDSEMVQVGFEQWTDRARALEEADLATFCRELARDAQGHRLLAGIFANSRFLTSSLLTEIEFARHFFARGPETALSDVLRRVRGPVAREDDQQRLMSQLRVARRQVALGTALCDITGYWALSRVTECLSDFADASLSATVSHLMRAAERRGEIRILDPDLPEEGSGLVIFAMGKHGARELNFSSDIDLFVLFDPGSVEYLGPRSLQEDAVRMIQQLVVIMQEPTADGYVCRVDLRLRPEPSFTPLAITVSAALSYYERRGQDWERAAMIKARPVAGDLAMGHKFLKQIESFVWRKQLDFWALRAIRAIKLQIDKQKGGAHVELAGRNIKLGRGGIREVEFLTQALQLVHGGRDSYLRCPGTVDALTTLGEAGIIEGRVGTDLVESYEFLRQVEHRLQMVDDKQTQTLPASPVELKRIANFLQFEELDEFESHLLEHLRTVEKHFTALFAQMPRVSEPHPLKFRRGRLDVESLKTLNEMGFADQERVSRTIATWTESDYGVFKNKESRGLFGELLIPFLVSLSRMPDPDSAIHSLDRFLQALAVDGRDLFSLLLAHRHLIDLVAEVVCVAPAMAHQLARDPGCLELFAEPRTTAGVLNPRILAAECIGRLRDAEDEGRALQDLHQRVDRLQFGIGIHALRHTCDSMQIGEQLAKVADGIVQGLHHMIVGRSEALTDSQDAELGVVGLGGYGTCELTVHSPYDLLLVHDGTSKQAIHWASRGERLLELLRGALQSDRVRIILIPLDRLSNSDLDLALETLRPSGDGVPAIVGRLSLVGARVIAGSARLTTVIEQQINTYLCREHDLEHLREAVVAMRQTFSRHTPDTSLTDSVVEAYGTADLIVRYLRVASAQQHPELLRGSTRAALTRLAKTEPKIEATAGRLIALHGLFSELLGVLHVALRDESSPKSPAESLKLLLAQAVGAATFKDLEVRIAAARDEMDVLFGRVVESKV